MENMMEVQEDDETQYNEDVFEKLMLSEILLEDEMCLDGFSKQHSPFDNNNLINQRELFFEDFNLKASSEYKMAKDSMRNGTSNFLGSLLNDMSDTAENGLFNSRQDENSVNRWTSLKTKAIKNRNRKKSPVKQNFLEFDNAAVDERNLKIHLESRHPSAGKSRSTLNNNDLVAEMKGNHDFMQMFSDIYDNEASEETKVLIERRIILDKMIDYKKPIPSQNNFY